MASEALINHRMNGGEWLALLLLSVLWGGSFFFAAVLIKTLPPFTIVFLRVGLAAVILNGLVKALGMRMPASLSAWLAFAGMGLLNNAVPFCLVVWGAEPHRLWIGGDLECNHANIDGDRGPPADRR